MAIKLAFLGLAFVVLANVVGQILFKISADRMREGSDALVRAYLTAPYIWLAIGCYFAASFVWVWVLRWLPLSTAYPVMALVFVLVPLAGVFLFNEPQGTRFYFGMALIVAGICVVTIRSP